MNINHKSQITNNNLKKSGFTLLEILLYIGILTIIISAIVPFAWTVINTGQKSAVQQEVFNNARYVSEQLKRQIRNASSVNAGLSNMDVNLAANPSYRITLNLPSPDTTAVINVSGGKIMVSTNGAAAVALNSDGSEVSELSVTNYTSADSRAKSLGFTLTLRSSLGSLSKNYSASTQFKGAAEMRN